MADRHGEIEVEARPDNALEPGRLAELVAGFLREQASRANVNDTLALIVAYGGL